MYQEFYLYLSIWGNRMRPTTISQPTRTSLEWRDGLRISPDEELEAFHQRVGYTCLGLIV